MPYPSVEKFQTILLTDSVDRVVGEYIFQGEAYVFKDRPGDFDTLRRHLRHSPLALSEENVIIVGSGKIGFSLSPDNFGRPFSDKSDVDLLAVDERLFDSIWNTLLEWNYPRRYRLSGIDWDWAKMRRDDLYWGWFRPDKIRFKGLSFPETLKPLRDISTNWFDAFHSLSTYGQFVGRSFAGRLYRTWDHARHYHVDSLRRVIAGLRAREDG